MSTVFCSILEQVLHVRSVQSGVQVLKDFTSDKRLFQLQNKVKKNPPPLIIPSLSGLTKQIYSKVVLSDVLKQSS